MIDRALLRTISDHSGTTVEHYLTAPSRLSGGFWATLYSFELASAPPGFDGRLVLRVMPDPTAGRRESAAQRWLAEQGFATPAVVASGHADELGGTFMIMRHARGTPPLSSLKLGPSLRRLPTTLRRLPSLLAAAAADLHRLDAAGLRAALDSADVPLVDPADRFLDMIAATDIVAGPESGFGSLETWLRTRRPASGNSICHGDLHPLNLLVDGDQVTVLDWTTAAIGSPAFDVGMTAGLLRCAPIGVPAVLRRPVGRLTNWLAESFISRYRARNAVDVTAVTWWEMTQYGRCLAAVVDGRLNPGAIVGPHHPFEVSAMAMIAQVRRATGCAITLPSRLPTL